MLTIKRCDGTQFLCLLLNKIKDYTNNILLNIDKFAANSATSYISYYNFLFNNGANRQLKNQIKNIIFFYRMR